MKTNKRSGVFARTCEPQVHVSRDHGIPLDPRSDFSERRGNRNMLKEAVRIVLALAMHRSMCQWTMALLWTQDLTKVNG